MTGRGRTVLATLAVTPLALAVMFVTAMILTPLPEPSKPETTQVVDSQGRLITRLFTENRDEIPLVAMPPHLLNALVAIEDDRFYVHRGIDLVGIARAAYRNMKAGHILEGGSTLTQQLARNLYLSQERTFTRKLREAVLTLKLEFTYSKKEILAMYWNTVYLGQGTYGVEVASQTYFHKHARDLTIGEAALLAGLPRSPEYYAPNVNREASLGRRNLVLGRMADQGFISETQADEAQAENPVVYAPLPKESAAPYFVDYVAGELKERFPAIAQRLLQGGYRIYTTLDLQVQRDAEDAVTRFSPTPADGAPQPEVALVAIEPATGYVRALVGGREKEVRRNRALERGAPGSAFAPFVYATALETYSFTAASVQMDSPAEFPGVLNGQSWRPQNDDGRYTSQATPMREALRRSVNVVTARWTDLLKPGPVIALAKRLGIQSPLPDNLTVGVGNVAVTPMELARAYAPFANGGFSVLPIAVLRVEDHNGNVIAEQRSARTRALDPGIAFIMTDLLKEVVRPGGTASNIAYLNGRPIAGKTGLAEQSRDSWFVGYTPDLVTAVRAEGDNRAAAPIWAGFVGQTATGRPSRDWMPPPNVISMEICSLTGLRPNASCPVHREWFLTGTAPSETDRTVHWSRVVPELPGTPWALPGTLPPAAPAPAP